MRKQRDTTILAVRIKRDLLAEVQGRTARLNVSKNSWVNKAIRERLRPHRKKGK